MDYPDVVSLSFSLVRQLKYGENPHQTCALYADPTTTRGLAHAKQLHGPPLGLNNYLDADAAMRAIMSFQEAGVSIVKHMNTCGLALRDDQVAAYQHALAGDPVSAYGGIVATNRRVTLPLAEALKGIFFEVLVCPDIDDDALERLQKRKKLRVLQVDYELPHQDIRAVSGGLLVQAADTCQPGDSLTEWTLVTDKGATIGQLIDLKFVWQVCRFIKSNGIVIGKASAVLGIGPGQPNRLQAIQLALNKAGNADGAVLASDAFMPFPDNVDTAAAGGVVAIVQPGGSIRDQQCIEAANKAGIAMYFTGVRHFLH